IRPGIAWEKWLSNSTMTLAQASSTNKGERESSHGSMTRNGPFELTIIEADSLVLFIHETKSKNTSISPSFCIPYETVQTEANSPDKLMALVNSTLAVNVERKIKHERWLIQKPFMNAPTLQFMIQDKCQDCMYRYHYWMEQS